MEHLQQFITDSTGAQVSNPRANTTNINKQGSGYTWANGYQMNGAQAKQGYGLTTTWTVLSILVETLLLHLTHTLHL